MDLASFMTAYWPVIAVAGSGLVGWGKLNADLRAAKKDIAVAREDHDIIVRLEEQHRALQANVKEVREDVKELLRRSSN